MQFSLHVCLPEPGAVSSSRTKQNDIKFSGKDLNKEAVMLEQFTEQEQKKSI